VAIREATGDILVFADDDRLAAPGFIAAHARGFSSPTDNTLVLGWQAGFLSWWEPNPEFWPRVTSLLQRQPELAPLLAQSEKRQLVSAADIRERFPETLEKFRLEEPWWERCKQIIADASGDISSFRLGWMLGTTGNMSVSRQRIIEAGLFDESFSRWGIEDTELCFRLCQAGARLAISQEALNYHQLHARSPQWNDEWHRNFSLFWEKYDSVQIPLYYLYTRRQVTAAHVNAIVNECERLEREGRPTLVNELKRMYRLSVLATQAVLSIQVPNLPSPPDKGLRLTPKSMG
jgi:hypothetical protein